MKIEKVAVVGTGTMGRGIVQVCAQAGYHTIFRGRTEQSVKAGVDVVRTVLSRWVKKGKMSDKEQDDILSRIKSVTKLDDLHDSDLVIEAVIEELNEKKNLFSALGKICRKEAILASTTSSMSITAIAAVTSNPERVLGIHFFDPAYATKAVEVVATFLSNEESLQSVSDFLVASGKRPISCKDTPGFVLNRIWIPFVLEAIRLLEAGIASKEDIDEGIALGYQHPWGPLTVADAAGLDIIYRAASSLYEELKDTKFAPPPLLARMVDAGYLGRKTGRGFYNYK